MRPFEEYLQHLRSSLEVDPRRAEEICAEVRGHLEERAAQFRGTGLSTGDAAEAAVRSFGDPERTGAILSAANSRHRALKVWRAALALGVVFGIMVVLVGLADRWFAGMGTWLTQHTPLIDDEALMLLAVAFMAPAAVLSGTLTGRRGWWIAGLPPFLWGALLWILGIAQWDIMFFGSVRETLAMLVAWPIGGGALLAGCGWLGARVGHRAGAGRSIAAGCWAYVLGVGVAGATMDLRNGVDIFATLAVVEAALGLIALAALCASPSARRHTLPVAGAAWAVCVGAMMIVAFVRPPHYYDSGLRWAAIAVVQAVAALGLFRRYRASERKARQSEASGLTLRDRQQPRRVRYDI